MIRYIRRNSDGTDTRAGNNHFTNWGIDPNSIDYEIDLDAETVKRITPKLKEGWVAENGGWYYYKNNMAVGSIVKRQGTFECMYSGKEFSTGNLWVAQDLIERLNDAKR